MFSAPVVHACGQWQLSWRHRSSEKVNKEFFVVSAWFRSSARIYRLKVCCFKWSLNTLTNGKINIAENKCIRWIFVAETSRNHEPFPELWLGHPANTDHKQHTPTTTQIIAKLSLVKHCKNVVFNHLPSVNMRENREIPNSPEGCKLQNQPNP